MSVCVKNLDHSMMETAIHTKTGKTFDGSVVVMVVS